jgi:predicted transcriptional regulator
MKKKDALDLEIRRGIYNHISKSPGLHERELARVLNIPLSTLDYHLNYIKQRGLVRAKPDGRYTRYYITGNVGVREGKVISVLRQNVTRKIIMFLLLNPRSSHRDVSNHIDLARSTTSFHLNKLIDLELINYVQIGREKKYSINEPDHISDLLITYKKTFLDKSVDRFIETWFEINPNHVKNQKK